MEDVQSLGEVFVEDFLEHHGVKGMKWGIRKKEYKSLDRDSKKMYRKKTSKERRADRRKAYEKNLSTITKAAAKNPSGMLVRTRRPGEQYDSVLTGKEFIDHLTKGGYVDARATQVFGYANTKEGIASKKFVDSQMDAIWSPTQETYVRKE